MQYDNVFYALDSRWTLLKTYYELDEITVLESQIDAFRLFLLRNKTISTTTKKQYKQRLQYLKKIIVLQAKSQKERQSFADFLLTQDVVTLLQRQTGFNPSSYIQPFFFAYFSLLILFYFGLKPECRARCNKVRCSCR